MGPQQTKAIRCIILKIVDFRDSFFLYATAKSGKTGSSHISVNAYKTAAPIQIILTADARQFSSGTLLVKCPLRVTGSPFYDLYYYGVRNAELIIISLF